MVSTTAAAAENVTIGEPHEQQKARAAKVAIDVAILRAAGLAKEVATIRARLENLSQELYDQIYVTVFTAQTKTRNLTSPKSKSNRQDLKLLHVSKDSRALFAKTYYGNTDGFRFDNTVLFEHYFGRNVDQVKAHKWLKVLPEAHRALIHRVLLSQTVESITTWATWDRQVVGVDLWNTRYHVSQADGAIAKKVYFREVSNAPKFFRVFEGAGQDEEWRHLRLPSNEQWAREVFLEGIQMMFDPGEVWG